MTTPPGLRAQALDELHRYLLAFPAERDVLRDLQAQLQDDSDAVFARSNMRGHITTSALVFDPQAVRVLLIHHQALDRWLQPGGHHEGQDRLDVSAAREACEETGVEALQRLRWQAGPDAPFDIETHAIGANPAKGEGAHRHHDFIYLFAADSARPLRPQWAEVKGARWMDLGAFAALPSARFARMARRLEALRDTAPR
jgi:8-oxo-dGTP pyrophosphatase MutT (NUDIX family)